MKGIIYVIKSLDENIKEFYIGSTFNFVVRRSTHKANCRTEGKPPYNYKVYQYIRDNGGFDNFTMDVLEEVEVNNKKELAGKELEHYNNLKPSLNMNIPCVLDYNEYHKKYNREHPEYHKKRYNERKDEYKAKSKERYSLVKKLLKEYNEKQKLAEIHNE